MSYTQRPCRIQSASRIWNPRTVADGPEYRGAACEPPLELANGDDQECDLIPLAELSEWSEADRRSAPTEEVCGVLSATASNISKTLLRMPTERGVSKDPRLCYPPFSEGRSR